MRTVETTVYQFEELSDSAKEKARDWWREGFEFDTEYMFETFTTAATLLGISIAYDSQRKEPDIRYSGFCSQGDGASFVGSYAFAKDCKAAIRKEFPTDETLHGLADELTALQASVRLLSGVFVSAKIDISGSGNYCHSHMMGLEDMFFGNGNGDDLDVEDKFFIDVEEKLLKAMRGFADWMYHSLEEEYDYQNSDEAVDDSIMANEYEFDEDGDRA